MNLVRGLECVMTGGEDVDEEEGGGSELWDDYLELLEVAKRKLEIEYREDGPPIGFHFDEVPRVEVLGEGKVVGSIAEQLKGVKKKLVLDEYEGDVGDDGRIGIRKRKPVGGSGQGTKALDARAFEEQLQKKRFLEDAKVEKKRQEDERKARKEQDKETKRQERLLLKEREREEREEKKRFEKEEKEREKEVKRKQKEDMRARTAQEREMKRVEREKDKERKSEERKRVMEEKRREKELQRVVTAKMREAKRELQRQMEAGPPDDLDLEWNQLMEEDRSCGYASGTEESKQDTDHLLVASRPQFPPESLNLPLAFPNMGNEMGGNLLTTWSFIHTFRDILGVAPFTVDNLTEHLLLGQSSRVLSTVHISLIRLIQSDMEESHNLVATQGGGGTANFMDRAVVGIAAVLDEAWSWGFNVDCWRAHLNELTWPEVLRQMAIAAGYGPRKPKAGRDVKPKLGIEGEDVIADESGSLRLKMPSRFAPGTVKAAAWQVLAEAGPEGLMIAEIAKRIQKQGLRDLRTSKTPEASVAGGLSRDIVFTRVSPATYALQAVVAHHRRLLQNKDQPVNNKTPEEEFEIMEQFHAADCSTPTHHSPMSWPEIQPSDEHNHSPLDQVDELERSEDELSTEVEHCGEPWISTLMEKDYQDLGFNDRLIALNTLCSVALDGPTIRSCLDARLENQSVHTKRKEIEERAEKKARADQAAEEAQKVLLQLGNLPQSPQIAPAVEALPLNGTVMESLVTHTLQNVIPSNSPNATTAWTVDPQRSVRYEPVGLDRRLNRYWTFTNDAKVTEDPCSRCLFVESYPDGEFKMVETCQQLEGLKTALDVRGIREGQLSSALAKEADRCASNRDGWRDTVDVTQDTKRPEKRQRLGVTETIWLPNISTNAERWIPLDDYISNFDFPATDSPMLSKLKKDLLRIEEVLSEDALRDWDRIAWAEAARDCRTLEELRSCLGHLEAALVPGALSAYYNRNPLIVRGAWNRVKGEVASAIPNKKGEFVYLEDPQGVDSDNEPLGWLPATYASMTLHLLALDAAIVYRSNVLPVRDTLASYRYIQKPMVHELGEEAPPSTTRTGNGNHGLSVSSSHAIGSGGVVIGSMLPTLRPSRCASKEEFSIPVVELREAALMAEANGSLYEGMAPVPISRSRGGRGGRLCGRGGRSTVAKKRKRSLLAIELEKEQDDTSQDGNLSGMDLDDARFSHDAWTHDLEQDY